MRIASHINAMSEKQEDSSHTTYRKVANKLWNMAEEYHEKGYFDLAWELKFIAGEIHYLARKKEQGDKDG